MSSDVEQTIQEKVRVLSPEQQQKVLDLVESLLQQEARKTIWEKLDERLEKLPPEAFEGLPDDASENLDHYLYGAPKK